VRAAAAGDVRPRALRGLPFLTFGRPSISSPKTGIAAGPPPIEGGPRRFLGLVAMALLGVVALVSVGQGFLNAINNSQDLQWSPAKLLAGGVNPYTVALAGNPDNSLILYQVPPYLHLLYVVILPIGLLPFRVAAACWAAASILLSLVAVLILCRRFKLGQAGSLVLLFLFLCGTPFRNAVGNGQTSLLLLAAMIFFWFGRERGGAGAWLSITSVKYSFAPPVWLWLVLERRFKPLLLCFALLVLGWLLFSLVAHSPPSLTLFQPLQVAKKYSVGGGIGDVMTVARLLQPDEPLLGSASLGDICGMLMGVAAVLWLWRRRPALSEERILAALCCICLLAFRHLGYDYVFLLPALAAGLAARGIDKWIILGVTGYFWFGLKAMDMAGLNTSGWIVILSFAMNGALLGALVVREEGREARRDWPTEKRTVRDG
jgi:hypothetical protein